MDNLVDAVKKLQEARGLNDTQLAERLGIDLSTWSKIKNGLASPGAKVLSGLAREFPELIDNVTNFLITGNGEKK